MNVTTIRMERAQAREKLKAFRREAHKRADAEYEAARIGYEALADGIPLIRLTQAFAEAGWDEAGNPRLAIARSDRRRVRYRVEWQNARRVLSFDASSGWGARGGPTLQRSVPLSVMPPRPANAPNSPNLGAIVPMIPADVRPGGRAKNWFTLFEAMWEPVPPVDPILLQHLGGDLYAVLAEWDLTELERAIIAGRLDG